ncbi:hypothetical protein G9A89_012806 [Geosiphon pyriformis]|nr:hypothetical protein G9A89_012806 [Geosiphon pyriformis]
MAYIPIAKLDNFTGEKNNTQIWLNNIEKAIVANRWNNSRAFQAISYFLKDTTDSWYQSLAAKPQIFNEFKTEFLRYFSDNNNINCLTNTFTTIKQEDTKAAIQVNYFTAPQILNQFIRGLYSSILQQVCPMHLVDLPTAITHARDFEAAKLEANHTQAVNLVMNGSSDLDSKLKQFSDTINQKLKGYLANNCAIYQPPQQRNNSGNTNHFQNQPYSELLPKSRPILNHLPANNAATNLSTTSISTSNLSTAATGNLLATAQIIYQPQQPIQTPLQNPTQMTSENPRPRITQNWRSAIVVYQLISSSSYQPSGSQHFLVTPEDATTNNSEFNPPQTTLTNNIPPATVTENKSLAAIFSFELEETINPPLFSEAALEEKPITTMYTDVKVNSYSIKLILNSGSAGSIITRQFMDQLGRQVDCTASTRIITANGATKTPIGEINDFPIEVNGIIVPIKVLIMKVTQY